MTRARLFRNGHSQAVRIPKGFALPGQEVFLTRVGGALLLVPADAPWDAFEAALGLFTEDFPADRVEPPLEAREAL
jgi:antitoxin VapB